MVTYKLNADERAVIGGGYTHVAKLTAAAGDFTTALTKDVYSLAAGDVVIPQGLLYVKTAASGGSGLVVSLGTVATDGTTYTATILPNATITSSTAGTSFATVGPTSTAETSVVYATGGSTTKTVTVNFSTVTGTYTAGEIWVFFTVIQPYLLADGVQL